MKLHLRDHGDLVWEDMLTIVCGDRIGSGMTRDVYTCAFDPKLVVKVERGNEKFQNPFEWRVWEAVKDTDLARWFAPCTRISDAGIWMLQKRTRPVTPEQLKSVKRVPKFFTDFKVQNWGWLDGKIVCHDFGTCLALEHGLTSRSQNARWWDVS